ncbi:hypothetical protein Ddye_026191 [Dipteronia dyeriana]|uniref:Zinc finger PMZ-type domain-containing protein n=1 Tax=Dipteronia dyeriana TaxID=168575 RepID=A0AAD9TLT7_9ROSI|nr:hypothetical protein Ddye_026191 [Dipteronia dyeriana]
MDPKKLVITYDGKWVGNLYEGGETEFVKICRNLTYSELSKVVQVVANVGLTRFSIELRTLVDTGVRFRLARPKIKDDSDVEMLLCDGGHVPEVFVQQLTAQFQCGGGSNNVLGSIPTTDNVFQTLIGNPDIFEDPTINEDESSIPEYNSHSKYGLDNFNEDYIGDGGSPEGVNDEATYHHGISSNSTYGGRRGSVPPIFTGLSRDTFEDGGINIGDRSETLVSQPWIIPGASNYSFKLVRTEESSSCNRLSKCGMFKSKKALKLALQEYAQKDNFKIHVTRSCTGRYEVGCKDPELSGRSLKPKEIMTDMQVEHRLSLLYTKALRAKGLAEQNIFGSPDLSYRLLPAYCHKLKCINHGTVTAIKMDVDKKFEYLFIAFSASLVRFQTAIHSAVCIDATHLKGRFSCVMFITACQDANNQVFPLAYGWGDVECEDSWTWFLKELKKAIGCPTNCIIIFDHSLAIKVAMAKEYPEIPHGLCGFHMNMNLKNRFKSHVVWNLFHEASRAHKQTEFLENKRELSRVNMQAYEYLMRVGPHRWSSAYCSVRRYGGMTSNIVECMNNCLRYARQLPITTLVEYVREMMQKWFHERRDAASRNTTQMSRWATEKLTKKNKTSHKYTVYPIDHVNFNVKDGEKDGLVNLFEKTYTCKEFQNDLLHCSHALAAIRHCKKNIWRLLFGFYKTSTWLESYFGLIFPIGHSNEWNTLEEVRAKVVLPPDWRSQACRPRNNRVPSVGEHSRRSRYCTICKKSGYN